MTVRGRYFGAIDDERLFPRPTLDEIRARFKWERRERIGRPSERATRRIVESFLAELGHDSDDFDLVEDGNDGWAFWIEWDDTTSYVHHDLEIEWYGTAREATTRADEAEGRDERPAYRYARDDRFVPDIERAEDRR